MKNLFDVAAVEEIKGRLMRLEPESARQWGTMNAAQATAHCSLGLEMAAGKVRPQRKLVGRILGPIIKPMVFKDDAPMRKNSPTTQEIVVQDERELEAERERLRGLIDQFYVVGPAGCTTHPHAFFGRLKPEEWAVLMYKHMDHHLRQFGV